MMRIDHVFVFPRDLAALRRRLESFGLEPSFRRQHPGQGTANICYCFDKVTSVNVVEIPARSAPLMVFLGDRDQPDHDRPALPGREAVQPGGMGQPAVPARFTWRNRVQTPSIRIFKA